MTLTEGANWVIGTWVCSNWLCAHLCSIGQYVGVMATHEMSQTGILPPLNPLHPVLLHPALPPIPSIPSICYSNSRKWWQKYYEIQPSGIKKVSYNKIIKYFTAHHTDTIQSWGQVFVTEYFKTAFLEIPLSAVFCSEGHIFEGTVDAVLQITLMLFLAVKFWPPNAHHFM